MKSSSPDLASSHPGLLEEWDYDKNTQDPLKVSLGSTLPTFWICPKGHHYQSTVFRRVKRGAGCPYCANSRVYVGYNDLATKRPDVAAEWDYERNGELTPQWVMVTTNKKAWWRCKKCGHCWEALISNRGRGSGCPNCRYKKSVTTRHNNNLKNNGSFADNYPDLLKDWDYEKNNKTVYPTDVSFGSNLRVYWKCHVCGHEWRSSINNRARGARCRKCSYKERQASNRKSNKKLPIADRKIGNKLKGQF